MKFSWVFCFYNPETHHSQIKPGGLKEAAGSVKNNINM
jgi:hypothetical protein